MKYEVTFVGTSVAVVPLDERAEETRIIESPNPLQAILEFNNLTDSEVGDQVWDAGAVERYLVREQDGYIGSGDTAVERFGPQVEYQADTLGAITGPVSA